MRLGGERGVHPDYIPVDSVAACGISFITSVSRCLGEQRILTYPRIRRTLSGAYEVRRRQTLIFLRWTDETRIVGELTLKLIIRALKVPDESINHLNTVS